MSLALSLARRGLGNTWPNPAVGCVLVREGVIVGRGWTQPGGRPHAERHALAQAGAKAKGAVAYVTLEPCSHFGKTPPCAQGLVTAGVARVVSAMTDPDPRVAGRGHDMLRAAGIVVDEGVLETQARALQCGFLSRIENGRPWLALKLATSFDGRIALASGESQWITSAASRAHVHALRAQFDAVMVGGQTARTDDPLLTVRGFDPVCQPVRVVAARHLDLPRARLAASAKDTPLWLCHGPEAPKDARDFWHAQGASLIEVPQGPDGLSPVDLLRVLGQAGLTRVFCEGGGQFAAALMRAGLVDELIGFTAGAVLGGDGRAALGPMGLVHLTEAPRYQLASQRVIGGDILHRWRRA
ncbi:bifunctional diaminohydroxyphosphoribosylaminopyrimidine deaminase/5-amino-6-(5-phosphoribosylamino)uracil reductase RibD [Rhodobacteraceae bacterium]|nr:bifunctional diaminohydroxyphosphoribosylaminopyrimidine deaminase/5-amino-6-(5-phosphoribosylamino)uracil reductase RibD [Paracoccaceae bacterium]